MKKMRLFLPAIAVLALLAMACSVCGNLDQIRSGLGELSDQATALATVIPDTEALQGTVEAQLTQVAEGQATTEAAGGMEVESTEAAPEESSPQAMVEDEAQAPMDLDMSLASLENLNSYRSDMTVRWEGTDNGEPSTGFLNIKYASVREPPAMHMEITGDNFGDGDTDQTGTAAFIQVADTAWFYDGTTDSWMQAPSGDMGFEEGFFFTPQDFLSDFDPSSGKRSLVPQDVNGISCYKYTFNENDFADMDPADGEIRRADGEAYVAVDGNYIVKLTMEIDMKTAATEEESFDDGTMWMDYVLSDVNQPIVIEPPADAVSQTQGRDDIPKLPDAEIVSAMDTFIMYNTGSSVRQAAEYYEREMPANGWQIEGESMIMDDAAFLNYTKDGATVSIVISTDEAEGTSVIISVE